MRYSRSDARNEAEEIQEGQLVEKEKEGVARDGRAAVCLLPAQGGASGSRVGCCGDIRGDEHHQEITCHLEAGSACSGKVIARLREYRPVV